MPLQQDIMFDRNFEKEHTFLYSFNENFILFDNLDGKGTVMPEKAQFYNSSFYHAFFVKKGTISIIADGVRIDANENDYLVIMPCTTIEFISSSATFFAFIIRAHIVINIYDKLEVPFSQRRSLFCIYHHHFNKNLIVQFEALYMQMKKEAFWPDYTFKELTIKEYTSIYILYLLSIIHDYPDKEYFVRTKRRNYYLQFLQLLSDYYQTYRDVQFYAQKLGISPKYLSSITAIYSGFPASVVIDHYVVFRIKVMLYDGELNVKKISEIFNFHSQSFFGRYFKRVTGLSPRDFIIRYNKRLYLYQNTSVSDI